MSKHEVLVIDLPPAAAERAHARRDLHYLADALMSSDQSAEDLAGTLRALHPRAAAVLSPTEVVAIVATHRRQ